MLVAGRRLSHRPESEQVDLGARHIGVLLPSGHLLDHLSVRDNLALVQRQRDMAEAKKLLKAAQFDFSKTYELVTPEDTSGLAESATLFASQAREAGIKVKVVQQESGTEVATQPVAAPAARQAGAVALRIGAVLGKRLLNYPGIGTVPAGAVTDRDTPVIAAVYYVISMVVSVPSCG